MYCMIISISSDYLLLPFHRNHVKKKTEYRIQSLIHISDILELDVAV